MAVMIFPSWPARSRLYRASRPYAPSLALLTKPMTLGGHGGVGIVAFGVGGQVEASLQIVLVNEGADLVGHVVLHLFRQHLVGRLGLLQPGHDFLPVQAQNLGHLVGDEIIGGLHLGLLLRLYGGFGAALPNSSFSSTFTVASTSRGERMTFCTEPLMAKISPLAS